MKPRMPETHDVIGSASAIQTAAAAPARRVACVSEQSLETRLQHVARRLAAEYPQHDPAMIAQLVHATSARLLARSKLAEFIPLFTERHVRGWLDEHPPHDSVSAKAS